ncbi:MAG TPA: hypothetical protein DEH78_03870 [Solibacterales bacterium]|nr:hypothetical protein [Bryobacterales bacterium]
MTNQGSSLSRFDSAYRQQSPDKPFYESLPDGVYTVEVADVQLTETMSTGNPMVKWTLRVIDGPHADRLMWKSRVITEKTLKFVKEDLEFCGVALDKFSDLPSHLGEMQGLRMKVARRTKGEWTDVYFQSRLNGEDADEDDLPF